MGLVVFIMVFWLGLFAVVIIAAWPGAKTSAINDVRPGELRPIYTNRWALFYVLALAIGIVVLGLGATTYAGWIMFPLVVIALVGLAYYGRVLPSAIGEMQLSLARKPVLLLSTDSLTELSTGREFRFSDYVAYRIYREYYWFDRIDQKSRRPDLIVFGIGHHDQLVLVRTFENAGLENCFR